MLTANSTTYNEIRSMENFDPKESNSPYDPFGFGNTYFCAPYHSRNEQYGLEYLDRNCSEDDVERVVILGYN